MIIDIKGIDKVKILKALYTGAHPQGIGMLHFIDGGLSDEEAKNLLQKNNYFDYLHGRVMKINLSTDKLDTTLYDIDNGKNAAEQILYSKGLLRGDLK